MALCFKNGFYVILSFVTVATLSLLVGYILRRITSPGELNLRIAMVISALTWITLAAFGALPYILCGVLSLEDALFESMSGFTGTGLTMFSSARGVEWLSSGYQSILFWRSLTQWIGGVGVIVLFIAIMVHGVGGAATGLYTAEGRAERIEPSIINTARWIWKVYVAYTFIGIILLCIVGMPLWDSINHAMTGLATGGFSIKNLSIASYDSVAVELVLVLIMVFGAISFALHKKLIELKFREIIRSPEIILMALTLLALTLLLTLELKNFRIASFSVISALTGTGFANAESMELWSDFSKLLIIIPMIMGGGYGSTSSALKLIRCAILLKSIIWLVKKYLLPISAIVPLKVGRTVIKEEEITMAGLYAFVYLFVLTLCAMVFMSYGHSMVNSFFEVASAQGNVGLSVGLAVPSLMLGEKITLILAMWMGRLEIFPVLILLANIVKRS
ncbi:MAG: TrkH family potassium uptake protein [Methanocellales archaeon]|nr:TrkH family potassium uptake protein [Methanocellales archaeon]MDD3421589.1 TrkH family potassium uptake protein [Methanocellales archaeon]MDD5447175.1 TrkH family potassium uptake protein [Methanocellales archaeon]